MIRDEKRLRETLGRPELARVVQRIRERLERGELPTGQIVLRDPSSAERDAVDRLLGRSGSRATALNIRLEALGDVLRHAAICDDLVEAVERLGGPVVNRRAAVARLEASWTEVFDVASRRSTTPAWQTWLGALRATGVLRRLASDDPENGRRFVDCCAALSFRLPADGVPLAELAAAVAGDSHALDAGEPIGTLGIRLAAAIGGIDRWERSDERREAWAAVGVMCDELSAPVLILNVPVNADTASGKAIRLHAESGEPYRVSVRQLLRGDINVSEDIATRAVFVCENPTVVAAAANRLGPGCPPLICTDGQLKTAARLLLARLKTAGADLRYHGDFDWGGIQIANAVIGRYGARAWRFATSDYGSLSGGKALEGEPVDATWDSALRPAMVGRGRAFHEELVLDLLIEDLRRNENSEGQYR